VEAGLGPFVWFVRFVVKKQEPSNRRDVDRRFSVFYGASPGRFARSCAIKPRKGRYSQFLTTRRFTVLRSDPPCPACGHDHARPPISPADESSSTGPARLALGARSGVDRALKPHDCSARRQEFRDGNVPARRRWSGLTPPVLRLTMRQPRGLRAPAVGDAMVCLAPFAAPRRCEAARVDLAS
jgi:hypothetical protein